MRPVFSVVNAGIRWTVKSPVFPKMATSIVKRTIIGKFANDFESITPVRFTIVQMLSPIVTFVEVYRTI